MQKNTVLLVLVLSMLTHFSFSQKNDSTKASVIMGLLSVLQLKEFLPYLALHWVNLRLYLMWPWVQENSALNHNFDFRWKGNPGLFFFGGGINC